MTGAFAPDKGILTIPEGVTELPDAAFAGRDDVISIVLPDSIQSLGIQCFAECPNLKKVRLPVFLSELPGACFAECGALSDIRLPETLERIGDGAFINCPELRSISFPDTLREINMYAFWGTGLERVVIPEGVELIGESAFWSCDNLIRADVLGESTRISENAFGSCYRLTQGYIAPGYPAEGDAPSELLYTLLWCSCPSRHSEKTSQRAEAFIAANEALIMERIFKYNNTAALSGLIGRELLPSEKLESYVRFSAENGQNELTALLLKAQGAKRDIYEEFEL